MHRTQAVDERAICIDLAAQRDDTGTIAHCFPHSLGAPVGDRRTYQEVLLARPLGDRDLKDGEQRTEERRATASSQCLCSIGQLGRKMRDQSRWSTRCGLRCLQRAPEPRASSEFGFPEGGSLLQLRRLPEDAFGCSPSGVSKGQRR